MRWRVGKVCAQAKNAEIKEFGIIWANLIHLAPNWVRVEKCGNDHFLLKFIKRAKLAEQTFLSE